MNRRFSMNRWWFAALLFVPCLALAAPFAYITNAGSNNVSVIDTASNTVVATIVVGTRPLGVAVDPTGTRVYVSNSDNHISVIDTTTNTVVGSVAVGASPVGVAVNPSGTRVYVANLSSNDVSVIDTASNTVIATVTLGKIPGEVVAPAGVAVNPAGTRVYVANGGSNDVRVIDTATNAVLTTIAISGQPNGVAVNAIGSRAYVTNRNGISIIDTATNSVVGSVAIGANPFAVAVNASGTRVYVANITGSNVSAVDTASNTVVATIAVGTTPDGVAVDPAGTRVYVANSGSNNVSVIDAATNAVVATVGVGVNPIAFGQFIGPAAASGANYQGLWWASPAGSESGWGINFSHQGDTIFASWFTYDLTGKGLWLVMTAPKTAPGVYTGTLYTTTGPAFNAVPFNPAQVVPTSVGSATLTFTDANTASFAYTVNGTSQVKTLTRQVFGTLPSCATATGSLAAATNYQDLWWAAPAGSESGWGINLTHQGDTIFASWFTYDVDHSPMWLVVTAPKTSPGVYSGTLYRTTGPAFNAVPFNPANVIATTVGMATFTFSDGNNASFAYTVNGVAQNKAITREVFQNPGTVCQ